MNLPFLLRPTTLRSARHATPSGHAAPVDAALHATASHASEHAWDEVHDAALESFPASDAPSWSALRAGPPSDY